MAVASAVVALQEATLERDRLHQYTKKIAQYDTARQEVESLKNKYGKHRQVAAILNDATSMRKRREKETVALEAQKLRRNKELYVKAMQNLEKIAIRFTHAPGEPATGERIGVTDQEPFERI